MMLSDLPLGRLAEMLCDAVKHAGSDSETAEILRRAIASKEVLESDVPILALRPKDAAKALGISERLLWSLTANNTIPAIKLGRCVIYSVETLKEWLRNQEPGAID